MSTYRFLCDHFIDGIYYQAGSEASTADVGGTLPTNWSPTPNVDPLDTAAVNAFYAEAQGNPSFLAAGPGLIRQQWQSTGAIAPPVTWFKAVAWNGGTTEYQLQGLGSGKSPLSV